MKSVCKRILALSLALTVTGGVMIPAAAGAIPSDCDETYYATLDYYGGLLDSSVVKSYRLNGADAVTDYGVYDEVINLTDGRQPILTEDGLRFELGQDTPEKFYFEGKTEKPFSELPWTIGISYRLNGVPTPAQELAGKTGLVEIQLDVVPNPNAGEYFKTNLVLTAATAFNDDEILSLEAQGAQVQLIGNLRAVLYMVLPGEEQHFTLRVGSDDFSFSGFVLLAVPATLQQLEQIADLREAKEKTEDSLDAIDDSMDLILNTLNGMSGSFSATANGLDRLNEARGTVSAGKDGVYDSLDIALDAAGPLADSLKPAAGHLTNAQQAISDTIALLNQMNENFQALKPQVERAKKALTGLAADLDELEDALDGLEDHPEFFRDAAEDLSEDFQQLGKSVDALKSTLQAIRKGLSSASGTLGGLGGTTEVTIDVGGVPMTVAQVKAAVAQAQGAYQQYEAAQAANPALAGLSFPEFLVAAASKTPEEAAQIDALLTYSKTAQYQEQIASAEQLNGLLQQCGLTVSQLQGLVDTLDSSAGPILQQLEGLCAALGSNRLSGDLQRLCDLTEEVLDRASGHGGALSTSAGDLKELMDTAAQVSGNVDTALGQLQGLTDIMNAHQPGVMQALDDAAIFADSASTGVSALVDAFRSAEGLLKQSGPALDEGTRQTLSGLSSALRQGAQGLGQTGVIQSAKDTITGLIQDEWDSHSGQVDGLLNMDASAAAVSITDGRNPSPRSVQYVMRTQEIQEEKQAQEELEQEQEEQTTFWGRVAAMFRDLWNGFTGLFHKKD